MANKRISTEGSVPLLLMGDFFTYLFSAGPFVVAWVANVLFGLWCYQSSFYLFLAFLALIPVSFFAVFVSVVFLIRICLPRLKAGTYPANLNWGMLAWILHLGLSRSGVLFGMREFILAFNLTKFLFWRALGGKINFRTAASLTVSLVDLPLITIGRGCTLSDQVFILCHNFVGNELTLSPVTLGENVFVGLKTTIWPNTQIENGTWIGMESHIGPNVKLGKEVQVGIQCRVYGTTIADQQKISNFETVSNKT